MSWTRYKNASGPLSVTIVVWRPEGWQKVDGRAEGRREGRRSTGGQKVDGRAEEEIQR